jgi:D-alanyl-lipoteichoic acid acyltransferase DltB (MBOAT superfamily)
MLGVGMTVILTLLVLGLWHGAAIKFVIWSGMHGLFHVSEYAYLELEQ